MVRPFCAVEGWRKGIYGVVRRLSKIRASIQPWRGTSVFSKMKKQEGQVMAWCFPPPSESNRTPALWDPEKEDFIAGYFGLSKSVRTQGLWRGTSSFRKRTYSNTVKTPRGGFHGWVLWSFPKVQTMTTWRAASSFEHPAEFKHMLRPPAPYRPAG
jgi:hypothetical protein